MHYAAFIGEMRVIKALLRAGAEAQLEVCEKKHGLTPQELMEQLANGEEGVERYKRLRVHRFLMEIYGMGDWQKEWFNGKFLRLSLSKGPYYGYQLLLTTAYVFAVFFAQPYFYYYYLSVSTKHWTFWTISFYIAFCLHLMIWLRLVIADPGFLPGKASYLSREFQDIAEGNEEIPSHQMLCVTCKILRPIRSKHCIVANKCVDRFDHFSPIINKPVGRRNYLYFLGFLVSAAYESLSINVLYGAYLVNQNEGQTYWQGLYNNIFLTIIFVLYASHFMIAFRWTLGHMDYIRLGMTGNEALNAYRYSYLSHPQHGTVYNPYEKENFNEAFTDIYNDCDKDVKELLEDLHKTTKDLQIQSRKGGKVESV